MLKAKILVLLLAFVVLLSISPSVVSAEERVMVDRTLNLDPGQQFNSQFSMNYGDKLVIDMDIEVQSSLAIDIYIMDEDNFDEYKNGNEFQTIFKKESVSLFGGSHTIRDVGTYRLVVDNTYQGTPSEGSVTVDIKVTADGYKDSDGDGHYDRNDEFPNDPSEWKDSDGDGYGDNEDEFPNDPSEWKDSDGDGYGDNEDAFPNDPSEWKDSDGDGVGDNSDAFPNDPKLTADSDGDGVADKNDAYPNDSTRSKELEAAGIKYGMIIIPLLILGSIFLAYYFYQRRKETANKTRRVVKSKKQRTLSRKSKESEEGRKEEKEEQDERQEETEKERDTIAPTAQVREKFDPDESKTDKMFCKHCGEEIDSDSTYCPECGEPVS